MTALFQLLIMSTIASLSVEDGLYLVSVDHSGTELQRPDGSKVFLSDRIDGKPAKIQAHASNNDSSKFNVSFDFELQAPLKSKNYLVLVIDNQASPVMLASLSPDNHQLLKLNCSNVNEQFVQSLAKHFGTEISRRSHPGYQMLVAWKSKKATYEIGDPVFLQLTITNVGDRPFSFMDGGMQRGARNNQFGFVARNLSSNKTLLDTGDANHFGGLAAFRKLGPNESFEREVSLKDWFDFNEPGTYEVTAMFELQFVDPDSKMWNMLWEDFATGKCSFNIGSARN